MPAVATGRPCVEEFAGVMEVVDLGWFAEVLGCDPGAASGVAGVAADAGGQPSGPVVI